MVTRAELYQAFEEAQKAGDEVSMSILATGIQQIEKAEAPKEKSMLTGMGKRLTEVGQGLKGAGLRFGEMTGMVNPETVKQYESGIAEERSVMSPTYRSFSPESTGEVAGGALLDVLGLSLGGTVAGLGKGLPYVGGALQGIKNVALPSTIPQAATGGALYGLTSPSETGAESLSKMGIGALTGGVTQAGLRQVGLGRLPESGLTEQQQEVARRAIKEGFQLDPTQITGYGGALKEGVKSMPFSRSAFTRLEESNQANTNQIAKKVIGLPIEETLTNESMSKAYKNALDKYKVLEKVPGVQGNNDFIISVQSQIDKLNKIPSTQKNSEIRKAIRVLEEYKDFGSKAIPGDEAFIRLKAIGENKFEAKNRLVKDAYSTLGSSFENSIEAYLNSPANLMRKTGTETLSQFREGRKTLANWYVVDKAFNPSTGNVSAAKLSTELSKRPVYGTTKQPLETAAMLSKAFPQAFPSSGTAERIAYGDIATTLAQAPFAIPAYAATSGPVRNILAQRYLGAKPEGIVGGAYGMIAKPGSAIPAPIRSGFGDILRAYETQQQMQQANPLSGLLGNQ